MRVETYLSSVDNASDRVCGIQHHLLILGARLPMQVRMIDEAETTLSSIDNASDRLVQSVLKQAHSSGAANYGSGRPYLHCCQITGLGFSQW